MTDGLAPLPTEFLDDDVPFLGAGVAPSLRLRDYWRWSASCLMDNTSRGILAEFLVTTALWRFVPQKPRVEWEAYDLEADIDGRRISLEVKSSSKVQSWRQQKHSTLEFRIAPTLKWNAESGMYGQRPERADIYVFCALVETGIESHRDALDVQNWRFRVALGEMLPDQETIGWRHLGAFATCCEYKDLAWKVETVASRPSA